jgi:hypothetical protein
VIGAVVEFVAVNPGTLAVPFAAKPINVFELDQAMVAPAGTLVKVCALIGVPAQTDILAGAVITGTGLTVTVPVAVPTHPDLV